MAPKDCPTDTTRLYRHLESKFENVAERLLLSQVDEKDDVLSITQHIIEQIFVTAAMKLVNNNITKASKLLGMSRNTLSKKLRESGRLP
jgi:DNA-binding protein Fis